MTRRNVRVMPSARVCAVSQQERKRNRKRYTQEKKGKQKEKQKGTATATQTETETSAEQESNASKTKMELWPHCKAIRTPRETKNIVRARDPYTDTPVLQKVQWATLHP